MKNLLKLVSACFAYFAVATLIAQGMILTYTWFAWGMDLKRGRDAIAVAKGEAGIEPMIDVRGIEERVPAEQPSFEEILQTRALKIRDIELRNEALSQDKAILRQQQDAYVNEFEALNSAKVGFESQVASYEAKTRSEGMEQNVVMLQSMDPQLAKVQFLKMYETREMESLVDIIRAMETQKLTEILDLFTTKDDEKKVADILRRIRDGFEFKPPIDTASDNLPPQR